MIARTVGLTSLSLLLAAGCSKANKEPPAAGSSAPQPGPAAGSAVAPADASGSAGGSAATTPGAGSGSAEPAAAPPAGPFALKLRVETQGSDGDIVPHFVPETGSSFPAVSGDGSKLAVLFVDEMDLSSTPISTVWVLDRSGKRSAVSLGGIALTNNPDATLTDDARKAAQAKREKTVADAQAAVAKLLVGDDWMPAGVLERKSLAGLAPDWQKALTPAYVDAPDADYPNSFLVVGDTVIAYRPKTGALELIVLDKGAVRATPVKQKFGAPGLNHDSGPPGAKPRPCGEITGLSRGFATATFGKAVLVPSSALGGDACVGTTAAEQAIVIDLPRPAASK